LRRVRICLLNNLYPPVASGSSHYCHELVHRLADRGHEVTMITAHVERDSPAFEEAPGIEVHRLPCRLLPRMRIAHNFKWMSYTFTPANLRRIYDILTERRVEVLHQNGHIFDLALASVRARKRLQLPLVLTIHAWAQHPHPVFGRILRFGDRQFLRRLVVRHCDTLVVPDKDYQINARATYGREQVPLVPYGVEYPLSAPPLAESWRETYRLGERPLIVSLGHVHDIRDRCDLIAAMPAVLAAHPDTLLLIVGEVYTERPVHLVAELGLGENVVFVGALPREEALSLVGVADLEAHWARQQLAGLGVASMEAMAIGRATMSYPREDVLDDASLTDWEHLVIARRDDPPAIAEDVIRLLGDADLRARMGAAGQALVRDHFSWDAACRKMERVYDETISAWQDQHGHS
jgi:glycosyltransferase involved in cell wall biosynthesis